MQPTKATSRARFHSLDGVTLVADLAGPVGAPTVVLPHGGRQTRHSWSGARHALAARGYHRNDASITGVGDFLAHATPVTETIAA